MTTAPAEADPAPGPVPDRGHALGLVPLALAVLAGLAVFGWVARRGFDLSDEGFYLVSVANPRDVTGDVLAFGYVYHPLLLLVGNDVTALRWAGVLVTLLACGWFAWVALGTPALLAGRPAWRPALRVGTALALGSTGTLTLLQLPASPSYNTLNLQALCVTAGGLVLAATRTGRTALLGWLVVGVGGWVTFLAKPTSAAVLAGLVLLAWAVVPGRWRLGVWAAAVGLLAAAGLTLAAYRMGPLELAANVRTGIEASNALGGHDDLLRLDPLLVRPGVALPVLALAVVASALLLLLRRTGARLPVLPVLGTLGLLAAGAGFVVLATRRWWPDRAHPPVGTWAIVVLGGLVGAALLVTVLAQLVAGRRRGAPGTPATPTAAADRPADRFAATSWRTTVALTVVLLALPAAYAFGTNGNLWAAAARAGVTWLVVLTARLTASPASLRLAPALVATVLLVPLQATATAAPYRYPDLHTATVPAPVGGGTLLLTAEDAPQAVQARALADRLGLRPGDQVLDLTGAASGLTYLLGVRPVGTAWIFGGYPGSRESARIVLDHARCAMTRAFVLVDEQAPRGIPTDVLGVVGLDLARDYAPVGELRYHRAAWRGTPADPQARAVLHRLTHPVTLPGC